MGKARIVFCRRKYFHHRRFAAERYSGLPPSSLRRHSHKTKCLPRHREAASVVLQIKGFDLLAARALFKRTLACVSFGPSRVAFNPSAPVVVSPPIRLPTTRVAAVHLATIMTSGAAILADRRPRIILTERIIGRLCEGNSTRAGQNCHDHCAKQQSI
jgi:hypothetical protein